MKLVAHCLVRNEENYIWYAINSVLNHVDEVMVWDTGSTDSTVKIVQSIENKKVKLVKKNKVNAKGLSLLRQEMLNQTDADWIMILDGDEIWWDREISSLCAQITSSSYDLVVSPTLMCVGDIYHYQEESAGRYKIVDKVGHYNIRLIRNIKGLQVQGIYPDEAYVNNAGVKIQDYPRERILFGEHPYLHLSHLIRSEVSHDKYKYDLGLSFPRDYFYPESLFRSRPDFVSQPWNSRSSSYIIKSALRFPLQKMRRVISI